MAGLATAALTLEESWPRRQNSAGEPANVANLRWPALWELLCVSEWHMAFVAVMGAQPHGAVEAAHLTSGRR